MTLEEWQKLRTPTEIYKRIVGYIRPTFSANSGKKSEMDDRKTYKIK